MSRRNHYRGLITAALLILGGCGGGGGGGGDEAAPPPPANTAPFGLTSRPAAAAHNFPNTSSAPAGSIALQLVASGFSTPVFFTAIPNGGGRHVVVEKGGAIKVLAADFSVQNLLLDLTAQTITTSEQGVLGIAFDPAVASNGYFYVHYSSAKTGGRCAAAADPRCSRIARFRLNSNGAGGFTYTQVSTAGEQVLLEVSQPYENHKGGMIAFGPDNYLYIGLGDGGSANDPHLNGQNRATLLGKVLRIDPHGGAPYAVPASNPFVGNAQGWRPEIWAWGLRNPWRFSFDRQSGDLWLADVGQGAWEEIDVIERGGNYGWNIREGAHPFSGAAAPAGLIDPVFEYDHSQGLSVTGGYVYRGSDIPGLQGRYIYGDFAFGTIWALNTATFANQTIFTNTLGIQISSFGEGADGELYVVDYQGSLYRLSPAGNSGGAVPSALSATGLFTGLAPLQPVTGLIEYEVNTPLWSDGAAKRRWIALPAGGRITFSADQAWQLPVGSVVVKHFAMALDQTNPTVRRNLETRVLVHETSGWAGYTYRWNAQQTDAVLLNTNATETLNLVDGNGVPFTRLYDYPSSAQCHSCHTDAAGKLLGVQTRQLNRNFNYVAATDNQLRSFNHIGLFSADIGAASQYGSSTTLSDNGSGVAQRARDYLDANCSMCHRPGGPTGMALDLRSAIAASAMNALDIAPTAGALGIVNARIIAPGSKERSVLWERMRRTSYADGRMPPLAGHAVDQAAVALIGQWIDSL